jgi:peptide deformylase
LVLINPVIKKFSPEVSPFQEGCLSIPGVYMDVVRPEVIEVSFKDENGRPRTLKANELLSRAIQHEMDHLTGVLFVDRVDNQLALNEELVKYKFSPKAVRHIK